MNLHLCNGYPFPCPSTADDQGEECFQSVTLRGVVHFEWLYTVTVEFADAQSMAQAQALTGWRRFWGGDLVLEAPTSQRDGYDHPAICAAGWAYCGFSLVA